MLMLQRYLGGAERREDEDQADGGEGGEEGKEEGLGAVAGSEGYGAEAVSALVRGWWVGAGGEDGYGESMLCWWLYISHCIFYRMPH